MQRRALRVKRAMHAGEILQAEDLEALRPIPSDGFPPYMIGELLGKIVTTDIKEGEHLSALNVKL